MFDRQYAYCPECRQTTEHRWHGDEQGWICEDHPSEKEVLQEAQERQYE